MRYIDLITGLEVCSVCECSIEYNRCLCDTERR